MHNSRAALAALLVLTAGCAGLAPSSSPTQSPTATPTDTLTQAPTPSPTPTASPTPEPTATAYPSWRAPMEPNTPMQDKSDSGRLKSVEFVNRESAEGSSGYYNFDLEVVANTSLEDVDPPDHGTPEGEPYFLVYVNGELMERSDYLEFREEGTFEVQVRKTGLERFDPGTLEVKLMLMDRDSEYDDIYGVWTGEIEYDPEYGG